MKLDHTLRRMSPSRLKQWIRHLHIENKWLLLMSLLLAIVLFIFSRQPVSDVKLFNVPLEYRGQRADVEISGEVTQTVSVRVRGPRDLVRSLMPSQLAVTADLTNKEAGERVIQLHTSDVSLPDNSIHVVQVEPASIRLVLEPKVKKRVSVEGQLIGQPANGLEVYGCKIEPDSIEIEGAESQVKKVGRLLTESVNLNGHSKSFETSVDVETPHSSLRVLTVTQIKMFVEVGERRVFRRFPTVPVHWLNPAAGGQLLTKTVEVQLYGPNSVLEALRPGDLRVEVVSPTMSGITAAVPQITLPDSLFPHVEVQKIIPNEVKFKK